MSHKVLQLYQQCSKFGDMGKRVFSIMFCYKAPYFWTIRPIVTHLQPGLVQVIMPHRVMSSNHIGTQHAIACCNLVEMAMGCVVEATIPPHLRWIPRGMNVQYLAKANGTLTATSSLGRTGATNSSIIDDTPQSTFLLHEYPGNIDIPVTVTDKDGVEVVKATIQLYISEKKKKLTI
jgi:acyl-coenzyme A thioesterase PaaI-like protein